MFLLFIYIYIVTSRVGGNFVTTVEYCESTHAQKGHRNERGTAARELSERTVFEDNSKEKAMQRTRKDMGSTSRTVVREKRIDSNSRGRLRGGVPETRADAHQYT